MNTKPNLMGRLRAAADVPWPVRPEVLKALCSEAADEIELLRAPAGDATDVLNDALVVVWRAQAGKGLDDLGGHLLAEMERRGYVVALQVRRPVSPAGERQAWINEPTGPGSFSWTRTPGGHPRAES